MSTHKLLPLASLLSLLLFAALACATNAGAAAPTPEPPVYRVQKCGTIGVRPGGRATVDAASARSAGNCFWRAYQQCRAASLVVSFGGIDTITTHTFGIRNGFVRCDILDTVQHRVIPQPARNGGTFLCRDLARTANELRFSSCGVNGDIIVPIGR